MPRGNDSSAALADLRGEFAGAGGTAEDLIASSRAAWPETLRTAQGIPRDQEYDEKLGKDRLVRVDIDKVQSYIGDDGVVLAAAKRGPYVIAVVEGDSGRTYKEAIPAHEVGFDKDERKRPSMPDPEDEQDSPDRAALQDRMKLTTEARKVEEEAEKAAQEARQKVYESHQNKSASDGGGSSDQGDSGQQSQSQSSAKPSPRRGGNT
jgi:hypothetical protein